MEKKKFDYDKAIEELEKIALKVEDPSTAISDIDSLMKKSAGLVEGCRAYLRSAKALLDDPKNEDQ